MSWWTMKLSLRPNEARPRRMKFGPWPNEAAPFGAIRETNGADLIPDYEYRYTTDHDDWTSWAIKLDGNVLHKTP